MRIPADGAFIRGRRTRKSWGRRIIDVNLRCDRIPDIPLRLRSVSLFRNPAVLFFLLYSFLTLVPGLAAQAPPAAPSANFVDLAEKAGLSTTITFGGKESKKYIIETTGTGI